MPALPEADYFKTSGGVRDASSGHLDHYLRRRGASGFSSATTAAEVVANWSGTLPDGSPKVFIVTGASTGLGLETAAVLAARGAEVIMANRSKERGDKAAAAVRERAPGAKVENLPLDLSSLQSVRDFAAAFKASGRPLHAMILNAGVMMCPFTLSADGHELQFATNHLGHFLLVHLLLDVLLDSAAGAGGPGRIVSVSSEAHRLTYPPPESVQFDKLDAAEGYSAIKAYGQSKLCNVLFARQLHARLAGKPVIVTSCHPGAIADTDLKRHLPGWALALNSTGIFKLLFKTIPQGAATQVYLATAEGVVPGEYYQDCNLTPATQASHSKELARKLWEVSEKLCGL